MNDQINLLGEFSLNEIHNVILTDIVGKLHTVKMKQLESALMLIEARFSRTSMEKLNIVEISEVQKLCN